MPLVRNVSQRRVVDRANDSAVLEIENHSSAHKRERERERELELWHRPLYVSPCFRNRKSDELLGLLRRNFVRTETRMGARATLSFEWIASAWRSLVGDMRGVCVYSLVNSLWLEYFQLPSRFVYIIYQNLALNQSYTHLQILELFIL